MRQPNSYGLPSGVWVLGIVVALGFGTGAGPRLAVAGGNAEAFVLSGVVIDAQGTARALLEEPQLTGGRSAMFRVGDTVGGFRVVSIAPDHVVLERSGVAVRIPLHGVAAVDRPAAPSATAAVLPGSRPPFSERGFVPAPEPTLVQQPVVQAQLPGPGEPALRPAWEGFSAPVDRPAAFDPEDFKRQLQQHLTGPAVRR